MASVGTSSSSQEQCQIRALTKKVFGYLHHICDISAPTGMSYQAIYYCSFQTSQLSKTVLLFLFWWHAYHLLVL